MPRHLPRGFAKAATLALLLALATCVGDPGTGPDGAAEIALPVHLQLLEGAADGTALPVNRIRAVVRTYALGQDGEVGAGEVLADQRFDVSPTAAEWAVDVRVPLRPGATADVLVELSLIHASGGTELVEFSGLAGPMRVEQGATVSSAEITLVRGPLANLFVTGVRIVEAPELLTVGASAGFDATVTTGGAGTPSVFWVSLDPEVLVMAETLGDATGSATGAGVAPGVARVVATAGAFSDTTLVEVVAPPSDLAVFKAASVLSPLEGDTVVFTVSVLNGGLDDLGQMGVFDFFPDGLTLESVEASTGTLSTADVPFFWDIPAAPAGSLHQLTLTATVDAGTVGSTLTNTAELALPEGYQDPDLSNNTASASVTVRSPFTGGEITVPESAPVGSGLQELYWGELSDANHGGTTFTVTSLDPELLLVAPSVEDPAAASVTVDVPDLLGTVFFYPHGLEDVTGTASVVLEAPGFTPDTVAIDVVEPVVAHFNVTPTVTWLSGAQLVTVYVGVEYDNAIRIQSVRVGGAPVPVTLTTSTPGVVDIVTLQQSGASLTVDIPVGQSLTPGTLDAGGIGFEPVEPGSATIEVSAPGFRVYTEPQPVTVEDPELLLFQTGSVPGSLQAEAVISLGLSWAHGGSTLTVSSGDPQRLVLSSDRLEAGAGSIDLFVPDGETSVPVWVQAVPGAQAGPVTVTVGEARFVDDAIDFSVSEGVVVLEGLLDGYTAGVANIPFQVGVGYELSGIFFERPVNPLVDGSLIATVETTDPTVVALVDQQNPDGARSVQVPIFPGEAFSPATLLDAGVELAVAGAGTATVTVTVPGFGQLQGQSSIAITVSP